MSEPIAILACFWVCWLMIVNGDLQHRVKALEAEREQLAKEKHEATD